MNFQLSYNWLKEFVDVRALPEELADCLSLHSVSVERLRRMGEGIDAKVVVGRVERIEAHPNADKLKVAYVAHRAAGQQGSRAAGQLARVVCGGTNLREGVLVAFAPPGAMVRWHGQGDPVELKPTEIRGVRSDGMICAASEIGLGDFFPAEGEREILDLSFLESERSGNLQPAPAVASEVATRGGLKPSATRSVIGRPLAVALGLDDTVLDCEITTNRPDLMSAIGLAREVAAITGSELRELGSYKLQATSYKLPHPHILPFPVGGGARGGGKGLPLGAVGLQLRIEDRSACPRYGAVLIDGVTVGSSPWWMQRRLLAAGLRPINNVVDATNYVLLETGQPLHAFDAERFTRSSKLKAQNSKLEIIVRRARAGESIRALDGNTYQLRAEDLVIASGLSPSDRGGATRPAKLGERSGRGGGDRPVAIAGVIGGEETGVTKETARVVLECANFDPLSVRRTSRALGIRTESSIRFEKGLASESVDYTIARAVELLRELAGDTAGRPVIVGTTPPRLPAIRLESKQVAARIGIPITPAAMKQTLTTLGCRVQKKTPGVFFVTPPWWRRGDLEGSHDLVEEIARAHGYHRLPSVLPVGTLPVAVQPPQPPQTPFDWEDRVRGILTGAGTTEVLTYSLTSRDAIERCGYTTDQAIALENPLSEELAYLRPSVVPTLLPLIAQNQGHASSGLLFELGNVYIPAAGQQGSRAAGLPREEMRLLIAAYGRMVSGGHVMHVKGIVEHFFDRLGIRGAEFRRSEQCVLPSGVCAWHPGRTTDVVVGGTLVGVLGEIHPTVVEAFGIDQRVAAAELDWAPILAACRSVVTAVPPSTFPAVKRDLAFTVDRKTPYADIVAVLERFDPLLTGFELFDQYEGGNLPLGKKSLAFHLTFEHPDRTLHAAEVDALLIRLSATLRQRFGAETRE